MINLLPENAKQELREDRFSRFLAVFGATVSLFVCIGILFLWIPWITLTLQEHELEKQLAAVRQSPLLMQVEEIESHLFSLGHMLDAYERNQGETLFASRIIDAVLGHIGEGVSVSFLSYTLPQNGEAPQFRIEGTAENRSALLAFSDALDADPMIENVRSPISNFLEESDIKFTLTFEVVASLLRITYAQ